MNEGDDHEGAAEADAVLEAYGVDYDGDAADDPGDRGIRASDRYVLRHDPLRAQVVAEDGSTAALRLGVDPGGFFCGHLFAALLDLAASHPGARPRVGFIHVPPDRAACPDAPARGLGSRAANLEQIARVVAVALRELAAGPGDQALLITGFGPFVGVVDNPTAAFVGDRSAIARAAALALPGASRVGGGPFAWADGARGFTEEFLVDGGARRLTIATATLSLATSEADALTGRYVDPAQVTAELHRVIAAAEASVGPLAAVIGLGVDSTQASGALPPTFKVEVQTRGWRRGAARARGSTERFRRDLGLAGIFLRARARGDDLLSFESG